MRIKSILLLLVCFLLSGPTVSVIAHECALPCEGCQSCVAGVCEDDPDNCIPCQNCVNGECEDDDALCEDCETCSSGYCDDDCTGCEQCEFGSCEDYDLNCSSIDCEICVDTNCVDRCLALGKYCNGSGDCVKCRDILDCEICEECNVMHECEPACYDGLPTGECDASLGSGCPRCIEAIDEDCKDSETTVYYDNEVSYCYACPGNNDCIQQNAVECYVVCECKSVPLSNHYCAEWQGEIQCLPDLGGHCQVCTHNPDKCEPIEYRYPTKCQ